MHAQSGGDLPSAPPRCFARGRRPAPGVLAVRRRGHEDCSIFVVWHRFRAPGFPRRSGLKRAGTVPCRRLYGTVHRVLLPSEWGCFLWLIRKQQRVWLAAETVLIAAFGQEDFDAASAGAFQA